LENVLDVSLSLPLPDSIIGLSETQLLINPLFHIRSLVKHLRFQMNENVNWYN